MSVGVAQAQTSYDFTMSGDNGGSAVFTFTVNNSTNIITALTGSVTGFTGGTSAITSLLSAGTSYGPGPTGTNNLFNPSGNPYIDNSGISFLTANGNQLGLWFTGTLNTYQLAANSPIFNNTYILEIPPYSGPYGTQGNLVASGGVAPEMNASLIPQVGLLLACLFFLFGRKKENTETLMTA